MTDTLTISTEEKIAAIRRELGFRRSVYPRWVEINKMSQQEADKQIRIMEAILEDYLMIHEATKPQQELF